MDNTLKVASLNVCKGLFSKEVLFLNMMQQEELDIIGVCETEVTDFGEQKPFTLSGFRTYWPLKRSDNNLKRMLCFVKEAIEVIERKDLMSSAISTIWLEHKPEEGHKILVCLAYREFNPCTGDIEQDKTNINGQLKRLKECNKQIEKAANECDNIFILGDMNVCVNKWNEKDYYLKKVAEEYQSILGKNGLELIDFGITWQRLQENGIVKESARDHLLSNHLSSISDLKKVYVTFSDHCAIVTDIIARKQKVKKLQISRDMRKIRAHPAKFIQELSNINWNTIWM